MSTTGFIAWWGAVIGTISLAWNVRRDVLQRGKLKVDVTVNPVLGAPEGPSYLMFTLVNVGHRPVTVVSIGGSVGRPEADSTTIQFGCDADLGVLPQTLNHSEMCRVGGPNTGILNNQLASLWALDSAGKRWRASRASMKALRAHPIWNRVLAQTSATDGS